MIGAADRVLVVLIGEPTSFADAYTLIKAASIEKNIRHFSILVNMSYSPAHARDTFERFEKITDRFLDVDLFFAGHMPISRQLRDSIVSRRPLMLASGESRESMMFRELANTVSKMPANSPAGLRFLGATDMAKGG
jgi:flagellar biosynthesis protein FlhG